MSFIKITEQNSLYNDLERKSVRDLLEDINTEDQKVALAVRETGTCLKISIRKIRKWRWLSERQSPK